jgi:hypothetical protein
MEIGFRGKLERTRTYTGIVNELGTILRRVASIHSETFRNSIPVGMFAAGCLPYEAAKTYRTIMTEFDCKRSKALVEAQRQVFRGL